MLSSINALFVPANQPSPKRQASAQGPHRYPGGYTGVRCMQRTGPCCRCKLAFSTEISKSRLGNGGRCCAVFVIYGRIGKLSNVRCDDVKTRLVCEVVCENLVAPRNEIEQPAAALH